MRKLLNIALCTALALSLACPMFAVDISTEQERAAAYLNEKSIMVGNESGDMMLDSGLTRAQMAALLTRIVANPEHVEAERDYYSGQCSFTDVPDWAKAYVGYCAVNHLVTGYGNRLYGPNDPVTPAAACTVMLRCWEDVDMEWNYSTACQTAVALGLASTEMLTGVEITRGNMAVLICRTMARMGFDIDLPEDSANSNIGQTTEGLSRNADGSINIPTDGSRYVPQAGDVIRCDDGSNYAVTDVSRYDKNMFADGPVGELPEPTCDWSNFPDIELPRQEIRRFTDEDGDFLFIRNLYETRRMLYTLYNAIGNNSETWQNGGLARHPSGNPKVRIYLTIPSDRQAEFFWPWREKEIIDPFNASPCGTYYLECWDVYANGVFQRTEYDILKTI